MRKNVTNRFTNMQSVRHAFADKPTDGNEAAEQTEKRARGKNDAVRVRSDLDEFLKLRSHPASEIFEHPVHDDACEQTPHGPLDEPFEHEWKTNEGPGRSD